MSSSSSSSLFIKVLKIKKCPLQGCQTFDELKHDGNHSTPTHDEINGGTGIISVVLKQFRMKFRRKRGCESYCIDCGGR